MKNIKPYRPNVAAVIMSCDYPKTKEIFLSKRNDMDGIWQFPQGGIDKGETPKEALFRELKEEIGTNDIKIIAKYPKWITYDFPKDIKKQMKPFYGQTQIYYLVQLKQKAVIDLKTKHPEFISYKFTSVKKVMQKVTQFKKPIYQEVIKYFKQKGYL